MNKIKSIIFIGLAIVVVGCKKEDIKEPIDRTVTFEMDIKNIVANNCQTCHSGLLPSADVDLTTYQNVRFFAEQGALLTRIEDTEEPMPPSGLLSDEHRQLIAKWATDGFPEK